jgi:hypothetical protein
MEIAFRGRRPGGHGDRDIPGRKESMALAVAIRDGKARVIGMYD